MSGHAGVQIAVAQMRSTPDVAANLGAVERLCEMATDQEARLLVLPEGFGHLGPDEEKLDLAEPLPEGGPILHRCQSLARQFNLELVLGGFWEKNPDSSSKVYNSCVFVRNTGEVKGIYRKVHLFDVDLPDGSAIRESDTVSHGDTELVVPTVAGQMGLSICYDLRFPELYRREVKLGAELLAVPSAFTQTTGRDHWHVLLRARAIESQCYVVAAAQYGTHFGTRTSYGHALIADPWGRILAEVDHGENVAAACIDLSELGSVRRTFPSLQHCRL